jgi:hypothetical protein
MQRLVKCCLRAAFSSAVLELPVKGTQAPHAACGYGVLVRRFTARRYSAAAGDALGKIFLDPATKDRRVSERASTLERVSSDTNTFWSSAHRRHVVVRLQDRAKHIEEVMEGCRRSLTTMFSVM